VSGTRGRSKQARDEAATPEDPHALTAQQQLFVAEYLVDLNGKQAAIRAGYSAATAESQASRLLRNVKVAAAVAEAMKARAEAIQVDSYMVVKGLKEIALFDPASLYDEHGALLPLHKVPLEARRALAGLETDELIEDGVAVGLTRKVKWLDRTKAYELLGKHLKLFTEKQELSGADGGPLQVSIAITRTVKEGA
jgi:phage terminase small subunit